MRIGIFSDAYKPYVSGVVTSIEMLKLGLENLGHEVYIITVSLPGSSDMQFDDSIIVYEGKKYPMKNFSNFCYVTKKNKKVKDLKKYNFDVIHIHTEFAIGLIGLKYAKINNIPCVTTYHTNYEDYFHYFKTFIPKFIENKILYRLLKKSIKKMKSVSTKYIVPTKKIEDVFRGYKFKFPIEIVPTGIDLDKFKKENQDFEKIQEIKNKYNLNDKFVLTFIGRISDEKSLDLVVEGFSLIKDENVVLLICGHGPAVNKIKQLVKDLNIENRVIFTGNITFDDISSYYHCSNLFVNASTTETQGLTFIEALASNLPLLIRKDAATKDVLIEEENGMYYETKEEFVEKINLLLKDKELYNKLKSNTLNSIEKFSKEKYALTLEKIYKEIIDGK